MGVFCMSQETQTGALYQPLEGWGGEGDGREGQKGGIYVYLWLIHIEVWQKTTKFCKAVIFQLKNKQVKIKINFKKWKKKNKKRSVINEHFEVLNACTLKDQKTKWRRKTTD